MDISQLRHDPFKVKTNLREVNNQLVTVKGCKIYIPVRFEERGLASVSVETYIVGIYAMVFDDCYSVSLINAMQRIKPSFTNKVVIDGDEYYEFVFSPGAVVIETLDLVQMKPLVYLVYSEIVSKARVPWYLGYRQLAHLFDSARQFAGVNIGTDHEVTELIISMITRNPQDRVQYYRQTVTSEEQLETVQPAFVPLKSVAYSATNTLNKIAGSYMNDGIVSALVSPSERVERIESLLRQ